MNNDQEKALKEFGVHLPKKKKSKKAIGLFLLGLLLGVIGCGIYIDMNYTKGFDDGVLYTAAYTTQSGNFTFMDTDGSVGVYPLDQFCMEFIQTQLNNQGGK